MRLGGGQRAAEIQDPNLFFLIAAVNIRDVHTFWNRDFDMVAAIGTRNGKTGTTVVDGKTLAAVRTIKNDIRLFDICRFVYFFSHP